MFIYIKKIIYCFSSQLKLPPEQYISHYELPHGKVVIYFNEVHFKSLQMFVFCSICTEMFVLK